MPYREDMNADYMLCNAFSREIPNITRSLIDWLNELPEYELNEWELSSHELSARAFYPRLLIGEFLADEFSKLVKMFEKRGHTISIKVNQKVVDIAVTDSGRILVSSNTQIYHNAFDHIIIASGHSWPTHPKIGNAELVSPWPYKAVTAVQPCNIAILGSSLSAIDIVIALGSTHGEFTEHNGSILWTPKPYAANMHITMLSKMGIMPEGDFYYPYPYTPPTFFSPDAIQTEISKGSDGLLQRLFALLCEELDNADPQYLTSLGNAARTVKGFSVAYFSNRRKLGGLKAVEKDFIKIRISMREKQIIPYRYVLLRAHEHFDLALHMLNETDWKLFAENLVPVFTDCYAAVPHLSLARIISMFKVNALSLMATGDDAEFNSTANQGVSVKLENQTLNFDVMFDARGQASAPTDHLPFPSLVKILLNKSKPLIAPFKIETILPMPTSIYCLALPQVLERNPFSQGLANCADNGKIVANAVLKECGG